MKFTFFKKHILIGIAITSFAIASGVFAQTIPVSNLEIDATNKILSGTINQTISGGDIQFLFENGNGEGSEIDTLPWDAGNFSTSLLNFSLLSPNAFEGYYEFDRLHIEPSEGQDYYINLSEIFGATGGQSQVSVDFSGWAESEYRQISGTDTYYPYVSSSNFQRNPSDTDVYLVLENTTSGQKTNLETYPGGSQFLSVTWPVVAPTSSLLSPNSNYKIYLSSTIDGSTGAINSTGQSTESNLGQVPGTGTITITNAQVTDNNTKVQINATAPSNFSGTVQFKIIGTNANNQNDIIELILGSIVNPTGSFTFPDASQTYALGGFTDYKVQAVINGEVASEFTIAGNSTGNGTTGNSGTTNNGTNTANGSSTPLLNNTQQNIVDNGIVTTKCGYDLKTPSNPDGTGRVCDFGDAITLIQRIIEYIFILVLPITAIVFAYAGYLYLTSGGNSTKRDAAKKAMTSVIIGVIIIMSAWLVVRTIVGALGYDTSSSNTSFYLSQ